MKRFFGGKKEPPPPPPSLTDASETVNKRAGVLDDKIKLLDKQLVDFKNQIKATRPGPAQARIKQRAMQVLKQKRMYEQQRDQVRPPFADFSMADLPAAVSIPAFLGLCHRPMFCPCRYLSDSAVLCEQLGGMAWNMEQASFAQENSLCPHPLAAAASACSCFSARTRRGLRMTRCTFAVRVCPQFKRPSMQPPRSRAARRRSRAR